MKSMESNSIRPYREAEEAVGLLEYAESGATNSTVSIEEYQEKDTNSWTRKVTLRIQNLLYTAIKGTPRLFAPTILQRHLAHEQKLRSTAWLDGLRGTAALIVAIRHFCNAFFPWVAHGWASTEKDYRILQFFWIRYFISAKLMVAMFFVISGFVLSHKSVRLIRGQQYSALLECLSSSVFRRWIRLMLPSIASILINFTATQLRFLCSPSQKRPPFMKRLWGLYMDIVKISDPWRLGNIYKAFYNPVLWTIQLEFIGSMIVFFLVLGLARTRVFTKLAVLFVLMVQCSGTNHGMLMLFIGGLAIAELDVLPALAHLKERHHTSRGSHMLKLIPFAIFILGTYVGSHPNNNHKAPGYQTLALLTPDVWRVAPGETELFWPSIGALLIVSALNFCPILQRVFTTGFAQYLGDISFSLYLVHWYIIELLCRPLVPRVIKLVVGESNHEGLFALGMLLSLLIIVPFTFWASDLFTRFVDASSVRLARKLETLVMRKIETDRALG
jgi:peptidoglycan/LPS O-acetylase OafA/YrhL